MKGLDDEVMEIPVKAREAYESVGGLTLPQGVPYVGMGSSYFAPLTLRYAGADIQPEIASEYYLYLSGRKKPEAVLVSQSGRSSETLWCIERFDRYTAVTNDATSLLAAGASSVVDIRAGAERFSSTKSYVNTLIALYAGAGMDPGAAVTVLEREFADYFPAMKTLASNVVTYMAEHTVKGLYVIGSGPNIGTAYEGALTLSETTKLSWQGMPVAQYDHGPKETADDTVVVVLSANGKDAKRIASVKKVLARSSALVVDVAETGLAEHLTPFTLISRLNVFMDALADGLKVGDTFAYGGKVTEVDESAK